MVNNNGGGFIPLDRKEYASKAAPGSADSSFWKSFKKKEVSRQIAGVTCIDFCPEPPHDFAVTSSTRVIFLTFYLNCLDVAVREWVLMDI